jgi:hypothetical protein
VSNVSPLINFSKFLCLDFFLSTHCYSNITEFACYIDISRAYDAIDRDKMTTLLTHLGVGRNIIALLNHSFEQEQAYLRMAGAYSETFKTSRGVKQGDVASPLLFNIVMDSIIREFLQLAARWIPTIRCGNTPIPLDPLFYADDGVFFATDTDALQQQINIFARLCAFYELEINISKTNVCAFSYPVKHVNISAEANIRRYHATRDAHDPLNHMRCAFCDADIMVRDLVQHWNTAECKARQLDKQYQVKLSKVVEMQEDLLQYLDLNAHLGAPSVDHYSISRIPLNGFMSLFAPRDALNRALVYCENDSKIPCPFGCATECYARTQLCGHAIDVHSEQVLILPRRKFVGNMQPPRICQRCSATFDNSSKWNSHNGTRSCSRRADRAELQQNRQRNDGRRSWWTAQLRAERNQHNIPFLVTCVSHWMKTAKERIVLPLD